MQRWDDLDDFLVADAELELRACGEVRPTVVAFHGARPLFIAGVRPFPKGAYHDPLIELLALAGPLDADRLVVCTAGRAWSLDDPVPPVTEEVDLRQRVLVIQRADGHGHREPVLSSTLVPFDLAEGEVSWRERMEMPAAEGWIAGAIAATVSRRRQLRCSRSQTRRQAVRCARLGHVLGLSDDVVARLELEDVTTGR